MQKSIFTCGLFKWSAYKNISHLNNFFPPFHFKIFHLFFSPLSPIFGIFPSHSFSSSLSLSLLSFSSSLSHPAYAALPRLDPPAAALPCPNSPAALSRRPAPPRWIRERSTMSTVAAAAWEWRRQLEDKDDGGSDWRTTTGWQRLHFSIFEIFIFIAIFHFRMRLAYGCADRMRRSWSLQTLSRMRSGQLHAKMHFAHLQKWFFLVVPKFNIFDT